MRLLIAGIGNIFRCDDGFGSAVVAHLVERGPVLPDGVRVVDYGIRGMHLAYDLLDHWDALILIDAVPGEEAGRLRTLRIGPDDVPRGAAVDAHGMDPVTVLAALGSLGGRLPEETLLVGCQVNEVGEGMGLSSSVEAAVDEAARTVLDLVARLTDRTATCAPQLEVG